MSNFAPLRGIYMLASSGFSCFHPCIQAYKRGFKRATSERIHRPVSEMLAVGETRAMRSNLVFHALQTVENRYMLCQLASKATRKFHRPTTRIQETMNQVLARISEANDTHRVMAEGVVADEAQQRAA